MNEEEVRSYARLVLSVGANMQVGQDVALNAMVEHAPFARAHAEEAYAMGARYVDIWWIRHAPEDTLGWTPPWLDARHEYTAEHKSTNIAIVGDPEPDLLAEGRSDAGGDRPYARPCLSAGRFGGGDEHELGSDVQAQPADGVVRDLEVAFSGGVITNVNARTGAHIVRGQLEADEGARHLGELALVDGTSPVGSRASSSSTRCWTRTSRMEEVLVREAILSPTRHRVP